MNPDHYKLEDVPKPRQEPSAENTVGSGGDVTPPMRKSSGQQTGKAKPSNPMDEVRKSLQEKVCEAAVGLESVFAKDKVDEASNLLVERLIENIRTAATNYLRKSAASYRICQNDVRDEILVINKLMKRKTPRKKPHRKKGSKSRDGQSGKGGQNAN